MLTTKGNFRVDFINESPSEERPAKIKGIFGLLPNDRETQKHNFLVRQLSLSMISYFSGVICKRCQLIYMCTVLSEVIVDTAVIPTSIISLKTVDKEKVACVLKQFLKSCL